MEEDENIFAYIREKDGEKMLVLANFTSETVSCALLDKWKNAEMLIHNYKDMEQGILRPYEAMIFVM